MSEVLLKEARDLIKAERYEEARAILQTLGDPEARALLAGLDTHHMSKDHDSERSGYFTASESDADKPVGAGPEE
jgi:hypothetical protein